jgi:hypothetical protein
MLVYTYPILESLETAFGEADYALEYRLLSNKNIKKHHPTKVESLVSSITNDDIPNLHGKKIHIIIPNNMNGLMKEVLKKHYNSFHKTIWIENGKSEHPEYFIAVGTVQNGRFIPESVYDVSGFIVNAKKVEAANAIEALLKQYNLKKEDLSDLF